MPAPRPLTIAAVTVAFAAGGGIGAAAIAANDGPTTKTTTVTTPASSSSATLATAAADTTTSAKSLTQLYGDAKQGVVDIKVKTAKGGAEGSGFVIDSDGHIVTNDHVIDGATSITVTFADKTTATAKLTGADPSSDLAVIQVDAAAAKLRLTPLTFADSSGVQVGQSVLAIGSPYGLEGTLTTGIVSALDRAIQAPNHYTIAGAIQTDAAINSGNSGGPLLNADGKVVGINAQIESSSGSNAGIGFAIPSNTVRSVAQSLISDGSVKHAYLGVQIASPATGTGALIGTVTAGSPGAKAGLKAKDVVTQIDGKPITGPDDLAAAVASKQPGDTLTLLVERGDARSTLRVTLGSH
jgi:putative serine protease PepD